MKSNKIKHHIDSGNGEPIVLLHGLFGALSNWQTTIDHFSKMRRVIVPTLPITDLSLKETTLNALVDGVHDFVIEKGLKDFTMIGNSLGGHLAIIYALNYPHFVKQIVLTASSGLFENSMGGSFPKRGNYEYIAEKARYTFFDPKAISEEYIAELFEATKDIQKALRIVAIAKSAQRNNMKADLPRIKQRTLLIWGLNDTITPVHVGHEFARLLPNSTLKFIDRCCHAPMMENPTRFNFLVENFLNSK